MVFQISKFSTQGQQWLEALRLLQRPCLGFCWSTSPQHIYCQWSLPWNTLNISTCFCVSVLKIQLSIVIIGPDWMWIEVVALLATWCGTFWSSTVIPGCRATVAASWRVSWAKLWVNENWWWMVGPTGQPVLIFEFLESPWTCFFLMLGVSLWPHQSGMWSFIGIFHYKCDSVMAWSMWGYSAKSSYLEPRRTKEMLMESGSAVDVVFRGNSGDVRCAPCNSIVFKIVFHW